MIILILKAVGIPFSNSQSYNSKFPFSIRFFSRRNIGPEHFGNGNWNIRRKIPKNTSETYSRESDRRDVNINLRIVTSKHGIVTRDNISKAALNNVVRNRIAASNSENDITPKPEVGDEVQSYNSKFPFSVRFFSRRNIRPKYFRNRYRNVRRKIAKSPSKKYWRENDRRAVNVNIQVATTKHEIVAISEASMNVPGNRLTTSYSGLNGNDVTPKSEPVDDFAKALQTALALDSNRMLTTKSGMDDDSGEEESLVSTEMSASENACVKQCLKHGHEYDGSSLKPSYPCDDWDPRTRTCYLDRNIGDTVTFILSYNSGKARLPRVIWKQEFHQFGQRKRKSYLIRSEKPLWNIVIGSKGFEFRVSPVTDMDVDSNYFSATLSGAQQEHEHSLKRLNFRIRPIPIDLGFVYPGETLVLNVESFVSLPLESMQYVWYIEQNEFRTLPSNMKKSSSGSILTISELRKEQEGIVTCAVYTNLKLLVGKKRFLISEIKENAVLMYPPNPNLRFKEFKYHHKLPKHHHVKARQRDRRIDVEEELEQSLRKIDRLKNEREGSTEGLVVRDGQYEESPFYKRANVLENNDEKEWDSEGLGDRTRQLPPPASQILAEKSASYQRFGQLRQGPLTTQQIGAVSVDDEFYRKEPESPDLEVQLENKGQQLLHQGQQLSNQGQQLGNQGQQLGNQGQQLGNQGQQLRNQEQQLGNQGQQLSNEGQQLSNQRQQLGNQGPPSKQSEFPSSSFIGSTKDALGSDLLSQIERNPIVEKLVGVEKPRPDDELSQMLAVCERDKQCSGHAICVQREKQRGFCRCRSNYHGSGIYCWENTSLRPY